jgi:parallel beta-helix repeat protein
LGINILLIIFLIILNLLIMKNYLIFTLAFLLLVIASCQKEIITTPEKAQTELKSLEDITAIASQYSDFAKKNQQKVDAELLILTKEIENLKAQRSQRFLNNGKSARLANTVINVPNDYPTLQLAVDNSQPGGKIFIKGTVSEPADVLVDVPELTIQGQGSLPTINGTKIMITASGVTVQNLKVNMAMIISGTTDAEVMNCNISATNNTAAIPVLLLLNSSNNSIKNCTIDGAYAGGSYEFGLFMDKLSNKNTVKNCIAKNTFGSLGISESSAFRIDGADNSITNCTALNFSRGFSSFGNACINNQFRGCVANNSINDSGFVFILPTQSNLNLENCTANGSVNGFFILGGSSTVSKCTANTNQRLGALIINTSVLIEKSTFNNNGGLGIYLFGVNNNVITKNKAINNSICDFNQTNCTGNTITDNTFGTSCTGL